MGAAVATKKATTSKIPVPSGEDEAPTGRFVYEVRLAPRDAQLDELHARLDVARRVYNALVSEALRRVDLMRESREFRRLRGLFGHTVREWPVTLAALTDAKAKQTEINAARKAAWAPYNGARSAMRARFEVHGSYSLSKYATEVGRNLPLWAAGHGIGAQAVQSLGARVWVALERYLEALDRGKAWDFRRPRFLRMGETRAVDGTGSTPAIRLSDDAESVVWAAGKNGGQLVMQANWPRVLDAHDQYARGLIREGGVAATRLVVRTIRGIERVYAQVTLRGEAYREPQLMPAQGVAVGADLGFREVAYVAPDQAGIARLSADAVRIDRELVAKRRRAQRALDRSRRATNPGNYNPNGTIKPRGQRKRWVRSAQYREIQAELAEDQRRVAAIRKTETGRVLNTVLPLGSTLHLEDLSYSAWQRGRTTAIARSSKPGKKSPHAMRQGGATARVFAPGEFAARAHEKWLRYGGTVIDIPAATAKLSQLCHRCGTYTSQPTLALSVFRRVHECACGVEPVQADLYQAFLARHTSGKGDVDLTQARSAWAGAVTFLAAAGSTYTTREQDGLRATSRPVRTGASEHVAAESVSPRSQDSACRSGVRPRGAEGESGRAGAAETKPVERKGTDEPKQRRSTPIPPAKDAKTRRPKRRRT